MKTIMFRPPVIVVAVFIFFLVYLVTSGSTETSAARAIVSKCAHVDHAPCYESEVPQLYPKFSVAQVFEVIRDIRAEDPSYQFCHVLAHKIGERVVAEDPEHWLDAIPLNPSDGLCSNGFIHGVVGGRFRAEVLDEKTLDAYIPEFARACEPRGTWYPTDLDKAICYHGLGHLYDFITDGNLPKALSLCSRTTTAQQFEQVCVEGVFMQVYQPLEPDDFALIRSLPVQPARDGTRHFCSSFEKPQYIGACLRESWPLHPGMTDGTGAAELCSGQPNATEEDRCYQAAFAILGRELQADPQGILNACTRVPETRKSMCYQVTADTFIEEDRTSGVEKAVGICTRAPDAFRSDCFSYLIRTMEFNFGKGSPAIARFCEELPAASRSGCPSL